MRTAIPLSPEKRTLYDYDSLGRLTSFAGPDHLTTTYTYTDEGQTKTVRIPGPLTTTYNYNDYGWLTSVVDPNSRVITYTYNDFVMKTTVTNWNNKDWDYTYTNGGIVTSATDPKNNSTEYTYNKKGLLTKTTNALDKEMCFSYNSLGLLDTVKDQRGKFVTYTYDCFGRMTEEKNDDGITTTYTYYDEGCGSCGGGVGKVKTKTDGKHITLTYTYDIMGRLDKIDYPNSEYVSYTYNANGNRLSMKDTRINYGDEKFTWEYDDLNRVTKETYPDDEYITYAYTVGGSRDSIRRPDNSHMKYTYDSRGRLSTIVDKKDSHTFTYSYNNDNTLDNIDYHNATITEYGYDSLYRISNITTTYTDTNPDTLWYSIDYSYDDVGNKIKAEWDGYNVSPFKYTKYYTYDNLYQLLTEKKMNQAETSRLYEYQYEFDDAGNRTKMKYFDGSTTTTTTYHYNDLNQMYLRCRTYDYNYTYDDNGNLTNEDMEGLSQREFTWNNDNRMTYVDNVAYSKEAEYTYDPMGRRIMRKDIDNNTYTYYYYDGLTVMAEKKKVGAGNPSWDKIYTVSPGVIGNILRVYPGTYYHYDAMGNRVFTSDFDGLPGQAFDQNSLGSNYILSDIND